MKKEEESKPVFSTPPPSAKVIAMLCDKYFVKMEKNIQFLYGRSEQKTNASWQQFVAPESTEPYGNSSRSSPEWVTRALTAEGVAPWVQGKLWANTGGITAEAASAKQGAAAAFLAELKCIRRKGRCPQCISAVMKPGFLQYDAQWKLRSWQAKEAPGRKSGRTDGLQPCRILAPHGHTAGHEIVAGVVCRVKNPQILKTRNKTIGFWERLYTHM